MLGEYNMGIAIKIFHSLTFFMSTTVSHLTEIAAIRHKIVMMWVWELERINRYQANMQLNRMKMTLWIDSKGSLAFIVWVAGGQSQHMLSN